jgi:STAM-binding protein
MSYCILSPIYPPPITTTSPPPSDLPIRYPEIMSQHQRLQGYVPSLHSMFNPMMRPPTIPSSLLFESDPQSAPSRPPQPYSSSHGQTVLYPADLLPRPSQPVANAQSLYPYPDPQPQPQVRQQQQRQQQIYSREAEPKVSSEPAPAPRSSASSQAREAAAPHPSAPRITRSSSNPTDPVTRELKSVNLPRECLPRFLSIASVNTARNRETCGLLLGKDKERKFVVTTLLIPTQHSTSDTCTMDEEELVLKFTEERSLITLGWVRQTETLPNNRRAHSWLFARFTRIPRNHVSAPNKRSHIGVDDYLCRFHVLGGLTHSFWFPTDAS